MYVVRHGQSEFNVIFGATRQDPGIEDPTVTNLGAAQIEETRVHVDCVERTFENASAHALYEHKLGSLGVISSVTFGELRIIH